MDVNVLLARLISQHQDNAKVAAWLKDKEIVLCPIAELGFLRISTLTKFGGTMTASRQALDSFARHCKVERIADDLPALSSHPKISNEVTDHYLSDLAAKHGLKLATLDARIKHPAVHLIS